MRTRIQIVAMACALLVAACGGAGGDGDSAPATTLPAETAPSSTEAATTSTPSTTAATTDNSSNPGPSIEGPPAPDFTTILADGSEFTLSAQEKPVYLIFWAEW